MSEEATNTSGADDDDETNHEPPATTTAALSNTSIPDLPSPAPAGHSRSFLQRQDEGLLRDVLDELDRERSKRAELEAKIRLLEQDLKAEQDQRLQRQTEQTTTSFLDYSIVKAERDGYLELIDALTQHRPALNSKQQTLPLHVARVLEIMPWDAKARPYLFAEESLWEWQILGADKVTWHTQLRYFPTIFKTLPIVHPKKTVGEAPTSSSPPRQCVLTNTEITQIINIDRGYPLPKDGGDWTWVGGWRVEVHNDSDPKGWSYSSAPALTGETTESSYYSDLRMPNRGSKNIIKRRRKWTRLRVLRDYPHASTMTKEFLKLVARAANLDISVEKLSHQLVETKMTLTTLEADQMALEESTKQKVKKLEKQLEEKDRILSFMEEAGLDTKSAASAAAAASAAGTTKDQVKELRDAVSQWVTNAVNKQMGENDSARSVDGLETTMDGQLSLSASTIQNNLVKQQVFESLRGKGNDFLVKIKQKGGEELDRLKQKQAELAALSGNVSGGSSTRLLEKLAGKKEKTTVLSNTNTTQP